MKSKVNNMIVSALAVSIVSSNILTVDKIVLASEGIVSEKIVETEQGLKTDMDMSDDLNLDLEKIIAEDAKVEEKKLEEIIKEIEVISSENQENLELESIGKDKIENQQLNAEIFKINEEAEEEIIETSKGLEMEDGIYQIKSKEDLIEFSNLISSGLEGSISGELKNDIDLENEDFTPILKNDGIFDGRGYEIKNLNVDTTVWGAGLFKVNNGTIKNLTVSGNVKTSKFAAGGIVGRNLGLVENCVNKARVDVDGKSGARNNAGGIAGENAGDIRSSINYGDILGQTNLGGIVGLNSRDAKSNLIGVVNRGRIDGRNIAAKAGGIVGRADNNGKLSIYNSYNLGDISANTNGDAGGVVGQKGTGGFLYINNSFNMGKLDGKNIYNISKPLELNEYTGKPMNPNDGDIRLFNNYYLGKLTDFETGELLVEEFKEKTLIDKLNQDIDGVDIEDGEVYVYSENNPTLKFENLGLDGDEKNKDEENLKLLEQVAENLDIGVLTRLDFNEDKNILGVLDKKIRESGYSGVQIELVRIDGNGEGYGIENNGDINYFYRNPSEQKSRPVVSIGVDFKLKLGVAEKEMTRRASFGWDELKVSSILDTEIFPQIDKILTGKLIGQLEVPYEIGRDINSKNYAIVELISEDEELVSIETGTRTMFGTSGKPNKLSINSNGDKKEAKLTVRIKLIQDDKGKFYEREYKVNIGEELKTDIKLELATNRKIENDTEYIIDTSIENSNSNEENLDILIGIYHKESKELFSYSKETVNVVKNGQIKTRVKFLIPKNGEFYGRVFVVDKMNSKEIKAEKLLD